MYLYDIFRITQAYIRTGSTRASTGGTLYTSTNFTQHPKYNQNTIDYDVGLLSPSTPIRLDNKTQVVRLANRGDAINSGTSVIVSGWGATSVNIV